MEKGELNNLRMVSYEIGINFEPGNIYISEQNTDHIVGQPHINQGYPLK